MFHPSRLSAAGAAAAATVLAGLAGFAHADRRTVCTITVNSSDEKQVLQRFLPADRYEFVELVEQGQPEWLRNACQRDVRCDVLVVSGHFDGGTEFYSDRFDTRESLPVDDLEQAACSSRCPGLFSQLKEVYLFGCNTLDADAGDSVSREIARTLERSGVAGAAADQLARDSQALYAESNRDAMRRIFANVPVIYGFSSAAPLGAVAGPVLAKALHAGSGTPFASGLANPALLKAFGPYSMVAVGGLGPAEPRATTRIEACRFADPDTPAADKLASVRRALDGELPALRMQFDRIEKLAGSIGPGERAAPAVRAALAGIADDGEARERYFRFARNTDSPEVRARMIRLSRTLGWLDDAGESRELADLVADQLQRPDLGEAEVELACALNDGRRLDGWRQRIAAPAALAMRPIQSAVLACLGDPAARKRALVALASPDEDAVRATQVLLRHHPLADAAEARAAALAIADMNEGPAQVRALETLASQPLADPAGLTRLAELFATSTSLPVQRAIAAILLRADRAALAHARLGQMLRERRVRSSDGSDVIDVLIRRLQSEEAAQATAPRA